MPLLRVYDVEEAQNTILRRAGWEEQSFPQSLLDGIERAFGERLTPHEAVSRILSDVRQRGDEAVRAWSQRLDNFTGVNLLVGPDEIRAAYDALEPELLEALRLAAQRIERFHRRQPQDSWVDNGPEGTLGQLIRPIERVGVYVPGGAAPLPSSLLMTVIPARVAGVSEVVVCTPPARDKGRVAPVTLVAADIAGVDTVYMAGGAQAIAAMAFGTASLPRVDKVCGAGGLFTTLAKRQVYGIVGIDGLPGPTETLVIADEGADPDYVAADLLAQAEHDVLASAILLTPSRELAEQVQAIVARQMEELSRADIIAASLERKGGIVLTQNLNEAVELANAYAPEHLCLLVKDPWSLVGQVSNAGGIFIGESSFEVLGDYVAGPSHVMPTEGTARFASPISVSDFTKRISLLGLTPEAARTLSPAAARLARAEGLTAHAAAAEARLQQQDK